MRTVVCQGSTDPGLVLDALASIRRPLCVVTQDSLWWECAAVLRLPRYFFEDKLTLMRHVLGKHAICLISRDGEEETDSMAASMYAMNVPIWNVMHMEV